MFMDAMNRDGHWWGEPNLLILNFEIGLTSLMLAVGIERFIDDLRHIHDFKKTYNAVLEVTADSFHVLSAGLMLGNFVAFHFMNVYWSAEYAGVNMIIAGIIMAISLERIFEDALK